MSNDGPTRHNWRNEAMTLRALLKIAYRSMLEQHVLIPGPLRKWIRAQRPPSVRQRIAKMTPDGLQQFILNNHLTVEDLKELDKCQ